MPLPSSVDRAVEPSHGNDAETWLTHSSGTYTGWGLNACGQEPFVLSETGV
jgi:hypothetical protein